MNDMTSIRRRRGQSLHLDLPDLTTDVPQVAAVFLVLFDAKSGYSIAWKRAVPGLELESSVEYKSLPSGLHNVLEDLIYFVHDGDFAGISAFLNSPSHRDSRNALLLAVGALVPLSYGRLGKSWKLAERLKQLARDVSNDVSNVKPLEDFWEERRVGTAEPRGDDQPPDSPSPNAPARRSSSSNQNSPLRTRRRGISTASALAPPVGLLSSHHPALSLPAFVQTFGPLIFPVYKSALLRKRLLLLGQPPVELSCNYVYDISILSGIPSAVAELLPLEPLPTRLPTLFSVGVHDIASLSLGSMPSDGWSACTTDKILSSKPQLYDSLLTLPDPDTGAALDRSWPMLHSPQGAMIKATQRDFRRYEVLRQELHHLVISSATPNQSRSRPASRSGFPSIFDGNEGDDLEGQAFGEHDPKQFAEENTDPNGVEPQSWSALAYDSFMWWASAGERRTDIDEEEESDRAMFAPEKMIAMSKVPPVQAYRDANSQRSHDPEIGNGTNQENGKHSRRQSGPLDTAAASSSISLPTVTTPVILSAGPVTGSIETSIIAFFHRFTERILGTLADIVETSNTLHDTDSDYDVTKHYTPTKVADTPYRDDPEPADTSTAPSPSQPRVTSTSDTPAAPLASQDQLNTSRNAEYDEDLTDDEAIEITSDDMTRMGLDVWSESDRVFVQELVTLYWGRSCVVRHMGAECCGIKLY